MKNALSIILMIFVLSLYLDCKPPGGIITTTTTTTIPPAKVMMGYVETLRNGMNLSQVNYASVDYIIHGFVRPNADGSISDTAIAGNFNSYRLAGIDTLTHNAGKKIIMSIGGATFSDDFPTIAANPSLRTSFANNALAMVQNFGYDGVDIDYETPSSMQERDDYTELMKVLYNTFKAANPDYLIMFGMVPAYGLENYDLAELSKYSDVAFYFGYTWDNPAGGPIRNPGVNVFLPGITFEASVKGAVDYILNQGFDPHKLVYGIPFYAKTGGGWYNVRADWLTGAPWLTHTNYMEVQINSYWWTTPESINAKLEAIMDSTNSVLSGKKVLRGVGWWEFGLEGGFTDLSDAAKAWMDAHYP